MCHLHLRYARRSGERSLYRRNRLCNRVAHEIPKLVSRVRRNERACPSQFGPAYARANTKGGGHTVFECPHWESGGEDLAVCYINPPNNHNIICLEAELVLTREAVAELELGPGDDVFMVGRFMQHEGTSQNIPTMRFGNISAMPIEPIFNSYLEKDQESFLVEMRSLSGYSGSPVFVYQMNPKNKARPSELDNIWDYTYNMRGPFLLGVDWCHLFGKEYIRDPATGDPIPNGPYVRSNTGIAAVVPAWYLAELLNSKNIKDQRAEEDEILRQKIESLSIELD